MMKYSIYLTIVAIFFIPKSSDAQEISPDLEQLVTWMSGKFTLSEETSSTAKNGEVTLNIAQIWPHATNGAWIYAEEVHNSQPDSPKSQRVLFLSEIKDSEFSIDEYSLPDKEKFVGAWKDPNLFSDVKVFDLKFKNGCTYFIFYDGFQYSGQTNSRTCENHEKGAAYSTSTIMVVPDEISLWDRGYDDREKLVWGTDAGPRIFKRKK